MRRLWLLLLLLWGGGALAEEPATVIVVDSSGSMAAALEGATRLDAARDVLRSLLADWPAAAPVALVAYGHRRTGDCADIEVLAPLGPPDPVALGRRLDDLRARGKTPLAASLEQAAALLPGEGNVILLTDGLETCDADPCAVARALHEAAVTIHVVGFGVTRQEAEELACIAEAGGGLYRSAAGAAELLDSLDAVAEVALAEPAPAPAPAPTPQQTSFLAVYAGSAEVLEQPADWTVVALEDTPPFTYEGGGRGLALTLEPGTYRVTASLANAAATADFIVADQAQTVSLALPVGRLQASAVTAKGQPALTEREGPRWTLEPLDRQPPLDALTGAAPELLLAAGRYRLAVAQDLWRAEQVVEIASARTSAVVLSLGLGGLTLEAALDEEGPAIEGWQGLDWSVLRDDGTVLLRQTQVARPRFLLPAGSWTLRLDLAGGAVSQAFTVAEGEERQGRLVLPAGRVTLTAALAPGRETFTDWRDSIWTVTALAALGQAPGDAALADQPANDLEVTLAPGRWLVAVRSDFAGAEREVEVAPGSAQTLRLDVGGARLTLQAMPAAGAEAAENTVFEVAPLAPDGTPGERLILGGASESLSAILPAGAWMVFASDNRARSAEQRIELAPGEEVTLELTLQ